MSDYKRVSEALEAGTDPRLICATCPWDRFCINPPTMSRADVEREMDEAKAKDAEAAEKARSEGRDVGMPMGLLVTAMTLGGRDTQASVCPVFVARLQSSDGRLIVDGIRTQMREWDDFTVSADAA